jgi:hypothetical protein
LFSEAQQPRFVHVAAACCGRTAFITAAVPATSADAKHPRAIIFFMVHLYGSAIAAATAGAVCIRLKPI